MKAFGKILALAAILSVFSIPAAMATPPIEDQPHMKEALEALKQARHHLEAALPDKGGHRTAAMKACDEAIHHTEEGIAYVDDHK